MDTIASAFSEEWIRAHATSDNALICYFETTCASYEQECIQQTIFVDDDGRITLVDESGGKIIFDAWEPVITFLHDSGAERLMEMRIGATPTHDGEMQ